MCPIKVTLLILLFQRSSTYPQFTKNKIKIIKTVAIFIIFSYPVYNQLVFSSEILFQRSDKHGNNKHDIIVEPAQVLYTKLLNIISSVVSST